MANLPRANGSAVREALQYALSKLSKSRAVISNETKLNSLFPNRKNPDELVKPLRLLGFKVTAKQLESAETVEQLSEIIGGQARVSIIERVLAILEADSGATGPLSLMSGINITPAEAEVIAGKINRAFRLQNDTRVIPGDLTSLMLAGEVVHLTEGYISGLSTYFVASDIVTEAAADILGRVVGIDDVWGPKGLKIPELAFRQAVEKSFKNTFQRIPVIDKKKFGETKSIAKLVAYIKGLI